VFEGHLAEVLPEPAPKDWTYHRSHWLELGLQVDPTAASIHPETDPP
jgi:leucyl/phenylalanyl-tRNA--protein transferase